MQLQAEIPSGTWPLEPAPPGVAELGRRLRARLPWRKMVIAVVLSLTVSVGTVQASGYLMQRHREKALGDNLALLRAIIHEYTADEHHAPHRLMDLVEQGYMIELPVDPFTDKADWDPDFADVPDSIDREHFGIVDVHSRSTERGRDGRAYCQW